MQTNNAPEKSNELPQELKSQIASEGPISISKYMEAVTRSYYERPHVFGRRGDFITSPEISQIFGELIGLWAITTWTQLGRPVRFSLIELGPGRGTLLADALRAISQICPDFIKAASIILVENSKTLRCLQKETLSEYDLDWQKNLATIPYGPTIILANEFVDAFPINQYQKLRGAWHERLVDYKAGEFIYRLSEKPCKKLKTCFLNAAEGSILEQSDHIEQLIEKISLLCIHQPGVALIIDYGYSQKSPGDSLQAIKRHRYHPVLKMPGTADITSHVDFSLIRRIANTLGAVAYGPVEQGLWLKRLGIKTRESQLSKNKETGAVDTIKNAVNKLVNPSEMGDLFKVITLTTPNITHLDGFSTKDRKC